MKFIQRPTPTLVFNNSGTASLRPLLGTGPQGPAGPASTVPGPAGRSVTSIARTSGTGAPGTTDTYTVTFSDAATSTFTIYNGANGTTNTDASALSTGTVADARLPSRLSDTTLSSTFARLSGVQATASSSGALVPGSHNPVDATSGSRTMTLADATSAGQLVVVSKKDSTTNTVTVSVAHLRDGGAGSIVLVGQYEAITLTSKADGSWWPVADHKTKAYFDATYASLAGDQVFTGTKQFRGPFYFGPDPVTGSPSGFGLQLKVKDDTIPWPTKPSQSVFELYHDGTVGNIFHLTSGPTTAPNDAPALIALGVDSGRTGLYVHNRADNGGGVGLKISQDAGVTGANNHGLRVNQSSGTVAAWFGIGSTTGTAEVAQFTANVIPPAGQKLVTFRTTRTALSDTLLGYVDANTGAFVWQGGASFQPELVGNIPLLVVGLSGQTANLQEWRVAGAGTVVTIDKNGKLVTANSVQATAFSAQGAGAYLEFYDTAGTANARRFIFKQNSSTLLLNALNDAGVSQRTLLQVAFATGNLTPLDGAAIVAGTTTGLKIASAATQKLGFYGATPVVQPSGTPAAATDLATALTLLNDMRSKMLTLGVMA